MNRIISGVQPTGNLHLGNYLGAIKNWLPLQEEAECLFGIMDLHSITIPQKAEELQKNILLATATLIACGINPEKSIIFNQSAVAGHAELSWILSCHTKLGWLNRMTQFKDKTASGNLANTNLGLYSYPVLMAADILLYKATHVPVGDDQTQHIQLVRDIAGAFNRFYNKEFFVLPEAKISSETARIMSLRDGTKKMSKSDASDYSRINLCDTPEMIEDKIRKAKSDMIIGITFDEGRPEANNLLSIYAALSGLTRDQAEQDGLTLNFSEFKKKLAEVIIEYISPISKEINRLIGDKYYLETILKNGNLKAQGIANKTLTAVKELVGFYQ